MPADWRWVEAEGKAMENSGSTVKKQSSAAAIVGLVLGVIGLLTSFLPIINNFSFVLAGIGLVFAIVGVVACARGKKDGKGLAIASLIVNVLAIVIVLATQSMYSAAIDEATQGAVSTTDGVVATQDVAAGTEMASSQTQDEGSTEGAEAAAKYQIADERLVEDTYSVKITGTYTNTSGGELGYVQLSYNLFDESGAQIGTAWANTSNLADGGVWKYEAYCTASPGEAASYELADVSGF